MTSSALPMSTPGIDIEMTQRSTTALVRDTGHLEVEEWDAENEGSDARPLLHTSQHDHDGMNHIELSSGKNYEGHLPTTQSFWRRARHARRLLIAVFLFSLVGAVLAAVVTLKPSLHTEKHYAKIGPYWPGFENIENYFPFGDSWTDFHFWPGGDQPSHANPIGNPEWPGFTSSNGANYASYLTTKYNHSFIKTYSMAWGGATIDATIDHPMLEWIDLKHEVRDSFLKYYTTNETDSPQPKGWTSENTLVSAFFGINDVMVYDRTNPQWDRVFDTYESELTKIYNTSARNFLLINVPPLQYAPAVSQMTPPAERAIILSTLMDFNARIRQLSQRLQLKHEDITIFEFDLYTTFQKLVTSPKSFLSTANYKEMNNFCDEYKHFVKETVPTTEQVEACGGLQVNDYLWINSLHITEPMHEAIAAGIEQLLISGTAK